MAADSFAITVTEIAQVEDADEPTWTLAGSLELDGDTYDVAFEYVDGEYGGHSASVTLEGVAQGEGSYFERTVGRDYVSDICQEVLWDVFEAQRVAAAAAIASVVGVRQVESLPELALTS